jgi:hypothetical protein
VNGNNIALRSCLPFGNTGDLIQIYWISGREYHLLGYNTEISRYS